MEKNTLRWTRVSEAKPALDKDVLLVWDDDDDMPVIASLTLMYDRTEKFEYGDGFYEVPTDEMKWVYIEDLLNAIEK